MQKVEGKLQFHKGSQLTHLGRQLLQFIVCGKQLHERCITTGQCDLIELMLDTLSCRCQGKENHLVGHQSCMAMS